MKVYQGTVETLLNNDAFVSEFLHGMRRKDLSRLIDDGIYAKLFIEDSCRKDIHKLSFVTMADGDMLA
jgi:peroxiredoxin